jgi:hypothetical protein
MSVWQKPWQVRLHKRRAKQEWQGFERFKADKTISRVIFQKTAVHFAVVECTAVFYCPWVLLTFNIVRLFPLTRADYSKSVENKNEEERKNK